MNEAKNSKFYCKLIGWKYNGFNPKVVIILQAGWRLKNKCKVKLAPHKGTFKLGLFYTNVYYYAWRGLNYAGMR